jgi:hypothetical protein
MHDIARNAMVSVFLRMLESHSGSSSPLSLLIASLTLYCAQQVSSSSPRTASVPSTKRSFLVSRCSSFFSMFSLLSLTRYTSPIVPSPIRTSTKPSASTSGRNSSNSQRSKSASRERLLRTEGARKASLRNGTSKSSRRTMSSTVAASRTSCVLSFLPLPPSPYFLCLRPNFLSSSLHKTR